MLCVPCHTLALDIIHFFLLARTFSIIFVRLTKNAFIRALSSKLSISSYYMSINLFRFTCLINKIVIYPKLIRLTHLRAVGKYIHLHVARVCVKFYSFCYFCLERTNTPFDVNGVRTYNRTCAKLKVIPVPAIQRGLRGREITVRNRGLSDYEVLAFCNALKVYP